VCGDVLHALILDGLIPTTECARVIDGLVILTGTVSWQYLREKAEFIATNVPGVRGIEDTSVTEVDDRVKVEY